MSVIWGFSIGFVWVEYRNGEWLRFGTLINSMNQALNAPLLSEVKKKWPETDVRVTEDID